MCTATFGTFHLSPEALPPVWPLALLMLSTMLAVRNLEDLEDFFRNKLGRGFQR